MTGLSQTGVERPSVRISPANLNVLMRTLEVRLVRLSECLVAPGWRLQLEAPEAPGLHYNLLGQGRVVFEGYPPIQVRPHTLIIVPAGRDFAIEADLAGAPGQPLQVQDERPAKSGPAGVRRHAAGGPPPAVVLICGYFEAAYGATIDLFHGLAAPIVEQFDAGDLVDDALRSALDELMRQEVGNGAMAAALVKQVMVTLLRRSLTSSAAWIERFSILSDPNIARAFARMVDAPGAAHSVGSLAATAGLGRSAFMRRFSQVFGKPPMAALRDLRLRRAAQSLLANQTSLDEVAYQAGYRERTGFLRAFRKVYGCDPVEYRVAAEAGDGFIGV